MVLSASNSHRYWVRTMFASVLFVSAALGSVDSALCSQSQLTELGSLVNSNKQSFQSCMSDLKLSVSTNSASDALAGFISEDYLQDKNADLICASENCVRALIQAMENLPDCCTQVSSITRNLPRLSDDILHQCDVRDANLLSSELEAEIAKLPDLKVQIKSLGTGSANSVSGSGDFGSVGSGVDVIIDVKKRELMKTGELGLLANDSRTNNSSVVASSNSAVGVTVSTLLLVIVTVLSTVQILC